MKDSELMVVRVIEDLIQRLESHEGWELREGVSCYLDTRDRNAIKAAKELLLTLKP